MKVLSLLVVLMVISCGGEDIRIKTKPEGSLGGDCYPNSTCDGELLCVSDRCVEFEPLDTHITDEDTPETDDIELVDGEVEDDRIDDVEQPDEVFDTYGGLDEECYPNSTCKEDWLTCDNDNICVSVYKVIGEMPNDMPIVEDVRSGYRWASIESYSNTYKMSRINCSMSKNWWMPKLEDFQTIRDSGVSNPVTANPVILRHFEMDEGNPVTANPVILRHFEMDEGVHNVYWTYRESVEDEGYGAMLFDMLDGQTIINDRGYDPSDPDTYRGSICVCKAGTECKTIGYPVE